MLSNISGHPTSPKLLDHLLPVLSDLSANPYPYLPNPPNCKKRASVALIIRIQPHPSYWPPDQEEQGHFLGNAEDQLQTFFAKPWVRHGEPEVLFIKRAARSGDRWTSHVALPGGRREEADEDDKAAAIRETYEEVGLELGQQAAIYVGNLPQKVVTTSWGQTPLMILCPYIFLLARHSVPSLKLQPSEVGSAHWVSLRALLSPSLQSYEYADVSDRLAKQGGDLARFFCRLMLGQMRFAAVRLLPSESLYCCSAQGFFPNDKSTADDNWKGKKVERLRHGLKKWWMGDHAGSARPERPLLLWGLTLGILADFLDLLPQCRALKFWSYPTFTPLDVRFWVWFTSYLFRKRRMREVAAREKDLQPPPIPPPAVEEGLDAIAAPEFGTRSHSPDVEILKTTEEASCIRTYYGSIRQNQRPSRSSTVGIMLEGYWPIVRRAAILALVARAVVGVAITWWLLLWYSQRRSSAVR